MKITYRIPHPKDQYAFVELTEEFDPTEDTEFEVHTQPSYVRQVYDNLTAAFRDGEGVGMKQFAQIVHEYCTTGAIQNGGEHDFSANEKLLLNELKKLIRARNK